MYMHSFGRLSISRYDLSFILFCCIRLFVPSSHPQLRCTTLGLWSEAVGERGARSKKRVNEKSYLEVERRSISAGWRRDGAEKKRTAKKNVRQQGSILKGRSQDFLDIENSFSLSSLRLFFLFLEFCHHHNIS